MCTFIARKEGEPGYEAGGTKAVFLILGMVASVRKCVRCLFKAHKLLTAEQEGARRESVRR